jgi:hypothetical protein
MQSWAKTISKRLAKTKIFFAISIVRLIANMFYSYNILNFL